MAAHTRQRVPPSVSYAWVIARRGVPGSAGLAGATSD
jgi:hypothetical protein